MTEERTETISITLPGTWKVRHWDEFTKAKSEAVEKNPNISGLIADFHGCLALWRAEMVQITGPDEFMECLRSKTLDNVPMEVIGTITREIGGSLSASRERPLAWAVKVSSNGSSGTT